MIISKLMGGMGNQLFQYALGRTLSLKHNVPLYLDITSLRHFRPGQGTKREYTLGAFRIDSNLIDTTLKKILYAELCWPKHVTEKAGVRFDSAVLGVSKNSYLIGYWLSHKYFESIRPTLLEDLHLKEPLSLQAEYIAQTIEETESVAIHVRRGDNVSNPKSIAFHGTPSIQDYLNNIEFFAQRLARPHFFIFSDDLSWCKANLPSIYPMTFVEGDTDFPHVDLHLMSKCKHIAMSNSTLSWWGAWLNENPKKIVLKPRFFTRGEFDTTDFYPKDWISL